MKLKDDIRQGQLEKFEMELATIPHLIMPSTASYSGAALRAAIVGGWIAEPDCEKKGETYLYGGEDVETLAPAEVIRAGAAIRKRYDELVDIDPNF